MIDPVKLPTTAKLQKPQNYDNLIPHELANLLPMIEGSKFAELKGGYPEEWHPRTNQVV
jgi:hypothetical protein